MKRYIVVLGLVLTIFVSAACGGTPTPQEAVSQATEEPTLPAATQPAPTAEAPTAPAATDTAPPPSPTAEAGPAVGGKVVMNFEMEVDTLDISKAMGGMNVLEYIGASLLALDPETLEVVRKQGPVAEERALQFMYVFQQRLETIRSTNPYYYTRLESDKAVVLSMNAYWRRVFDLETAEPEEDFEEAVAGSWEEPEHGAMFHRSARRMASWSWRASSIPVAMTREPQPWRARCSSCGRRTVARSVFSSCWASAARSSTGCGLLRRCGGWRMRRCRFKNVCLFMLLRPFLIQNV